MQSVAPEKGKSVTFLISQWPSITTSAEYILHVPILYMFCGNQ
jgi:hypothetical protein